MKKLFTCVFVLVLCFSSFASLSDIQFTSYCIHPLYENYKADIWNSETQIGALSFIGSGIDSMLVQTRYEAGREDYYHNSEAINGKLVEEYVYEYAKMFNDPIKYYLKVKPSLSFGLFRLNYKDYTTELYGQFGLNAVFSIGHGNDMLSFDGMYGLGISAAYKDLVKIRVGIHHYSGHYGDEVLDSMWQNTDEKNRTYSNRSESVNRLEPGYIEKVAEYVRQDALVIGVSVNPVKYVRLYAEADIVKKNMNTLRPWILIPNNVNCTVDNEDMIGRIGSNEGVLNSSNASRKFAYSDKYRALILNMGVELSYDLKTAGEISLSYNCRLNQEGQTMYQFNCYQEDNPWDIDHTVRLSYQFNNSPLSVDAIFYNGRAPMLNYFYYHDSYFYLGCSVNL